MHTSAPLPSVSARIASTGSVSRRVDRVRRAELLRPLELLRVEVDGDDRARAREARARDRGVAHAAASEHRDAVAAADVAGEHRGAEPGHHAAAEQAGGLGAGAVVDLRGLTGGDERLLRERADAERGGQLGAVGERHLLRRVEGREAVPGPAAPARAARAAHRPPVQDDEVAGPDVAHVVADGLDDARGLVAEQEREVVVDRTLAVVQVGVAHAARLHAYERLARSGVGDHDRLDGHRRALGARHHSTYLMHGFVF